MQHLLPVDIMYLIIYLICVVFLTNCPASSCAEVRNKPTIVNVHSKVNYLIPNVVLRYDPAKNNQLFGKDLRIYCNGGHEKSLTRFFETIELRLKIDNDDYSQYFGNSPEQVQADYDQQRSLFSFNLFTQKHSRFRLSPFVQSCLGLETDLNYSIQLFRMHVDFWRLLQLILGVSAFMYSGSLSRNTIFYYLIGILAGICFSFMLVIWLCSKLIPGRPLMYGAMLGGWAIGFYLIQLIWDNVQVILITYKTYVFWYIVSTGLISFIFCYRWGPPANNRSKNIIKWLMQIVALATIYFCSFYEEASAAIIMLTILFYYFPRSIFRYLRTLWYRRFPPKPRLISMAEYYEQGVRETNKALDELRTYVSSPECKQWKLMTTLKDPIRFASFAEGASHLEDSEILSFHNSKSESENEVPTEEVEDEEDVVDNEGVIHSVSNRGLHNNETPSSMNSNYNRLNSLPCNSRDRTPLANGRIVSKRFTPNSNRSTSNYQNSSVVPEISDDDDDDGGDS